MTSRSTRLAGCLSDYALDRRLARELTAEEETAAYAHVGSCARCARRFEDFARQRDAFTNDAPPLGARTRSRPKKAWPGRLFVGGAGAALAAAAVVLLFVTLRAPREGEGTRAKGSGTSLGFFVNHGGNVRSGVSPERVAAGDGVRFVVTTLDVRYLAVLSVDGARHASVYYPSGPHAERVASGPSVALPESTTLDGTLGEEVVYGVFCPEPFEVEPLRRALERAPDRAPVAKGCDVETLHLRKEAVASP